MGATARKIFLFTPFLLLYGLLFYLLMTSQLRLDFSCFYSAAIAYREGLNPYQNLIAFYLTPPTPLSANLTPPFFLQIISPLTLLPFSLAAPLWGLTSFALGVFGAILSFKLSCSPLYFKKNWPVLLFIYLSMYSTLMNTSIGQLGNILLFFLMTGYYFYTRKREYGAGICWGIIISIKLFPALLFLFVLYQKRYKVFFIMLITCILAFLLPLLTYGPKIYFLYFYLLTHIMWFGDNWNASLYGLFFRLFVDARSYHPVWLLKTVYFFCFATATLWYSKKIILLQKTTPLSSKDPKDHRPFCLTLAMMLLLSPMGWLYYFSLLLMPLTILWQALNQGKGLSNKTQALGGLCLFLINFPIGYEESTTMGSLFYRLGMYSFFFYGLLLLIYLLANLKQPSALIMIRKENPASFYLIQASLALGLWVTLGCLLFIIKA